VNTVKEVNDPIVTRTHIYHLSEHSSHMYASVSVRIGMMTGCTGFQTHNGFCKKHVTYSHADIIYMEIKTILCTWTT
jgi:hypothetical protein